METKKTLDTLGTHMMQFAEHAGNPHIREEGW